MTMSTHVARWLAVTVAGLTVIATGLASGAQAAPASGPALARPFPGRLYGITATSSVNAWAVGLSDPSGSLIMHWNGRRWSRQASADGFFTTVAATSASRAWAVGGTGWFRTQPLVEQWKGHGWGVVPTPRLRGGGFFNGVTAVSPCNVWAVGTTGGGPGDGLSTQQKTLIEHWNGHAWSRVPSPAPGAASELESVAATSARNMWAVGWTGTSVPSGLTSRTLILHWNGRRWKRVPSPSGKPGVRTRLAGVLAFSARDAWAVGAIHLLRNELVYFLHWNGRSWTRVHSPVPNIGGVLLGIGGVSPDNIWAVGQTTIYGGCSPVNCEGAILHWNGHRWKKVPVPNPPSGYLNAVFGVVATSARNAWAAGTTDYASTLIMRWNGHRWN